MSKSKKFSQSTINELLEPKVPLFHPIKIFNISNRSFFSNKQVEIRGNSENDNDDYVINTRMSEKVIDKANTCKHGISNTGIMTNYDSRSLVNEDETLLLSLIDATSQKKKKKNSGLKTQDLINIAKKRKQMNFIKNKSKTVVESKSDGVQTSFIFPCDDNSENIFEIVVNNVNEDVCEVKDTTELESNQSSDEHYESISHKCEETQVDEIDFAKYQQQNETREINITSLNNTNDNANVSDTLKKINFFEETLSKLKPKDPKDKINFNLKLVTKTNSRYDNNNNSTNNENRPSSEIYRKKHIKNNSCIFIQNPLKNEKSPKEKENKKPENIQKKKKNRKFQNYSDIYKEKIKKIPNPTQHKYNRLNNSMDKTNEKNSPLTNRERKYRHHNQSSIN